MVLVSGHRYCSAAPGTDTSVGAKGFNSPTEALQVLVILLLNPANSDAHSIAKDLTEALANVLFLLKAKTRKLLVQWLSELPADVLGGRCIRPLQAHLTKCVEVRSPDIRYLVVASCYVIVVCNTDPVSSKLK